MKKVFNFDDCKGRYVMHCKNFKEANDFCQVMDKAGKVWCNGDKYIENIKYDEYMSNTVYYFNEGKYGTLPLVDRKHNIILEWSDFMHSNFISIEIDPTDPKQAHAAVTEAIETHRKKQREWTADEIEQARTLSHELICKWFDKGNSIVFSVTGTTVYAKALYANSPSYTTTNARPSCDDTFNETIGKYVCLCKITGNPVPDFIQSKNK